MRQLLDISEVVSNYRTSRIGFEIRESKGKWILDIRTEKGWFGLKPVNGKKERRFSDITPIFNLINSSFKRAGIAPPKFSIKSIDKE